MTSVLLSYLEMSSPFQTTSVVFSLKMQSLNLIIRKHWTNPNRGLFCKITHQYFLRVSAGVKKKKDRENVSDWRSLKRHDN